VTSRAHDDLAHAAGTKVVFAVTHRIHDDGTVVLAVEGELDLASAPNLKWELAEALRAEPKRIVLDMSGVSFIDSTALGVLVGAQRNLEPGRRLSIAGARPDVLAVFELTGLDATFDIHGTLDEALGAARHGGSVAG
jgi:anti-sigma B factor antagonist